MVGWISALKIIPWSDVIEAAPGLAKSARKFFTKTQQQTEVPVEVDVPAGDVSLGHLQSRIHHLEQSLAQMAQQQKASAELIESLAEQNAQVVRAIDVLRVRTRLLIGASVVLLLACVALAFTVTG